MKELKTMLDTTQQPPSPLKLTKTRSWVSPSEYEETLNLVRNTLKIEENETLLQAGYSGGSVATRWRKDNRFPLLAVNALKGLLVGHEIAKQENELPLLFRTEDLVTIANSCPDKILRASLYREVARRLEK